MAFVRKKNQHIPKFKPVTGVQVYSHNIRNNRCNPKLNLPSVKFLRYFVIFTGLTDLLFIGKTHYLASYKNSNLLLKLDAASNTDFKVFSYS